jgi:hypothetical protein
VQVYSDRAVSGASPMRPGIQSLMHDATHGKFDGRLHTLALVGGELQAEVAKALIASA